MTWLAGSLSALASIMVIALLNSGDTSPSPVTNTRSADTWDSV